MIESSIIQICASTINSGIQNLIHTVQYRQVGSECSRGEPILFFGKDIPTGTGTGTELVHGGAVKLQRLQDHFSISKKHCNILYLVSSSQPPYANILIRHAKKRGVKLVWNQNGVSYPASDPVNWEKTNKNMKTLMHNADYVIYQSKFCKDSADEFLGAFNGSKSVIYNCVDTNFFTPQKGTHHADQLTLLLGGNQYRKYRLETALQTVAELKKEKTNVQLIVTGKVAWDGRNERDCLYDTRKMIENLAIIDNVEFVGSYSQKDAPDLYCRADMLLHTKWRDPCPGLVIEAMSCGLPIIYSKSGGMPEIVGSTAGIGISAKGSWEQIEPPDPKLLSDAVLQVADRLNWYSANARKHAVERFDISQYITQHRNIFEELLSS